MKTAGNLLQSAFYCNLFLKCSLGMKSLGSWGGNSTRDIPILGYLRVPQCFLRGTTYQTVQSTSTKAGRPALQNTGAARHMWLFQFQWRQLNKTEIQSLNGISHMASARQPHGASGYRRGQHRDHFRSTDSFSDSQWQLKPGLFLCFGLNTLSGNRFNFSSLWIHGIQIAFHF